MADAFGRETQTSGGRAEHRGIGLGRAQDPGIRDALDGNARPVPDLHHPAPAHAFGHGAV
jgi:hypothetical protein